MCNIGREKTETGPLIALDAFLKGNKVNTLYSMPFMYDGEQRLKRAQRAFTQLYYASNIFITKNNNRLTDFKSMKLDNLDMPMVKYYRQLIEGEDYHMCTHATLQDTIEPISIHIQELSKKERI